jgi:hypothetical protein
MHGTASNEEVQIGRCGRDHISWPESNTNRQLQSCSTGLLSFFKAVLQLHHMSGELKNLKAIKHNLVFNCGQ